MSQTIVLVSMPWASAARPSLGIGVLTAQARRAGFDCRALHPDLAMATRLTPDGYEALAESPGLFGPCEHVFAVDVFGPEVLGSEAYLEPYGADGANAFRTLRDTVVPKFLDQVAAEILQLNPRVVGFSCTFNQVMPSVAAARRLKRADPSLTVLLGGACVHGKMGETYAAALGQWIDHVFTGEADGSFVEFLHRRRDGGDLSTIPGVTSGGRLATSAIPTPDIDRLPFPEFGDWFDHRARLQAGGHILPDLAALPFESSRGCWWGEKSHCTFCGLNNDGMTHRAKSVASTLADLTELSRRHGCVRFMAADNILRHDGYRTLLPAIADLGLDLKLFYEIKANVRRDDMAALSRAGVEWVQPGIESFSDAVLDLMGKGVSALQNIQFLKWAREFGVRPSYNILVGFPGEADADYEAMLAALERITHLPPPSGAATIVQVHRFSPFFQRPDALGIVNPRPADYYAHLIPAEVAPATDFAYFFERDIPAGEPVHRWLGPLNRAIADWTGAERVLTARFGPGFMEVETTARGVSESRVLDRLAASVMVLADRQIPRARLIRTLQAAGVEADAAILAIDDLTRWGLMIAGEDRVLSLVPFARPHTQAELDGWLRAWGFGAVESRPARADSIIPPITAKAGTQAFSETSAARRGRK